MPTLSQLREAVAIAEQIEKLQSELASIIGNNGAPAIPAKAATTPAVKTGKRIFSAESRAKMAAAQAARWAKTKGPSAVALDSSVAPKAKKKGMSPEGRARIAAAQRARHAAKRAKG